MQAAELSGERAKCVTGIDGLDSILGGGIPISNMVLVTGGSGTGKTTLAVEFLLRGASKGEKGLLISTFESPDKMMSNIPHFDFFDEKYVKDGTLQILELGPLLDRAGIKQRILDEESVIRLAEMIEKTLVENGVKRFVLDSLSSLLYGIENQMVAKLLLQRLSAAIYASRCTGLLISDKAGPSDIEGLVSDGIISMDNHERRGDLLRTIQVTKMKGTSHSRSKYVIDLTSWGVLMTPLLKGGGVS
jgi:circadian clock protein KaiC